MDSIDLARLAMEAADDAYANAIERGASNATLDRLAQATADAELAYYRACETWQPLPA